MKAMSSTSVWIACVLCACCNLLAGCAHKNTSTTSPIPATTERLANLTGREFTLDQLFIGGQELPLDVPGKPITVQLMEGGKITGQAPVNRFTGSYQLGRDGKITWPAPGLAGTRMAGPPEAMKLEQSFFTALTSTSLMEVLTNGVAFRSNDGSTRLEFISKP